MVNLTWGAATSPGHARLVNEDTVFATQSLFVVADGMGGLPAGDAASQLAVAEFAGVTGTRNPTIDAVLAAVSRAHEAIASSAVGERAGMGTTLVGLALVRDDSGGERWFGFNVGDSRLYRFAGGVLEQVSTDHSEIQELISAGAVAESLRYDHPQRHVVTRALGVSQAPPEVDCWLLCPVPGERFLLCSDGLPDELLADRIADLLAVDEDPAAVAQHLVDAAVLAGGRDNVSAVVVEVATPAAGGGDCGSETLRRPHLTAAGGR